ncbi:MAG TPA: FAD-binding oxidoreductase, partial [Ktedonobacteraceae bacterium]|nr:FAD-binding oxidoreductase [Ktedonobacteraceae bacterium]
MMTTNDALQPQGTNRRDFLKLSILGGLTGLLAACQNGSSQTGTPTPGITPTLQPSPTVQPSPGDADWAMLANSLQGTLIRPGNAQYTTARQLFSTRFDNILPTAIAYCSSPTDVQHCLAFARRFNVPFAPRSGGHSYAGYSTSPGLVIDVTRMNTVTVNTSANTATIGAGARLIDVYNSVTQYGLILPAGSCPTVGITGLTLGGGVGVISRKFGLTCDNLLSAQVITANGNLLTCDANNNTDLFWALRGGGGGNFGIVTSLVFQLHAVAALTLFTLDWPWSVAANMVDAWQNWVAQAPDELWSNCLLLSSNNTNASPVARVNGVYVGNAGPLNSLLQQLIQRVGSVPTDNYVFTDSLLETMMVEAGCYGKSVAACHLPSQNPQGQLQRDTSGAKSDYFTSPLPRQGIDVMINAISQRQSSSTLGAGGIGLDAYGGTINRVASNATAFVHRNALFSAQYTANWNADAPDSTVTANYSWLNGMWQALRPYASGAAYQNYIDPHLDNWQQAYYGAN